MAKSIGLKQLAAKKYETISGLPEDLAKAIGEYLETAFDISIIGASGNGKSNFTVKVLKALLQAVPNWKCEYVSYEEGHAMTVQMTMIDRHNMLEEVGNRLVVTEHLTYQELVTKMAKKQSAKIWVIDSIQASAFTTRECQQLRERFVLGKKKKIIIWIGWANGKVPDGAVGKSVEYYAMIKVLVEGFIAFTRGRYGGGIPYVIWEGQEKPERKGALGYWGAREYYKITGKPRPKVERKKKAEAPAEEVKEESVTKMQILPPMTEEEIAVNKLRQQTMEAV